MWRKMFAREKLANENVEARLTRWLFDAIALTAIVLLNGNACDRDVR